MGQWKENKQLIQTVMFLPLRNPATSDQETFGTYLLWEVLPVYLRANARGPADAQYKRKTC